MEDALQQDESTSQEYLQNGPRRITRFNVTTGVADRQVAYVPQPRLRAPLLPELLQVNGTSDLLVAAEDRLWIMERAFFPLLGFRVRIDELELTGASDTLYVDALDRDNRRPAKKCLLLDVNRLDLPVVDNFEVMSCGAPRCPTGMRRWCLRRTTTSCVGRPRSSSRWRCSRRENPQADHGVPCPAAGIKKAGDGAGLLLDVNEQLRTDGR